MVAENERYALLCRALQSEPNSDDPLASVMPRLQALEQLIHSELLALARQASPDDFADVYLDFTWELERFREFAAYPHLAHKTIVAFGGSFSAGKSSLINALIGKQLMVVEIDPTTALPAYVLSGSEDSIYALNQHGVRITLSDDEFASLTHDESRLYGSDVSRSLSAAFVVRKDFPWENIAFIDTPGYSGQSRTGERTDAKIAAAQLDSAHAVVWVVNVKQGVIPETDLEFLAKLNPAIPRLILVTRADQVNEDDLNAIVSRIQTTLLDRNLPVVGVLPVSAHPRHKSKLEPVVEQLQQWNQSAQTQTFARRFKALFVRYQRGLEKERKRVQWARSRLNQLELLAEDNVLPLVQDLSEANHKHNHLLESVAGQLAELRMRFFHELKRIGAEVGIPLPEPHEMDLLDSGQSNLLEQLIMLREKQDIAELDVTKALSVLCKKSIPTQQAYLIRRKQRVAQQAFAELQIPAQVTRRQKLLRQQQT